MPFKTRRQKQSAAQRRFSYSDSGAVIYSTDIEKTNKSEAKVETKPNKNPTVDTIENLSYVGRDLLRIVSVAFLIIAAQLILRLTLS